MLDIEDYGEASDSELKAKLPGWESDFSPMHAVFFGPDPSGFQVMDRISIAVIVS